MVDGSDGSGNVQICKVLQAKTSCNIPLLDGVRWRQRLLSNDCGVYPTSVPLGTYCASIFTLWHTELDIDLVCPASAPLGTYSTFILMPIAFALPLSLLALTALPSLHLQCSGQL